VRFVLQPDDFAFYDQQLRFVIEPGTFTISTGNSSEQLKSEVVTMTGALRVLDARPLPFR
jgi:beta-glucosidase